MNIRKWVGALLIAESGEVILQKRDINKNIVNPGKITLFGGSVEEGEGIEGALKREIKEELNINIGSFKYFGMYQKNINSHGEDCDCYVYLVPDIDIKEIRVSEGRGYTLISVDNYLLNKDYSLITQSILKDYFKN